MDTPVSKKLGNGAIIAIAVTIAIVVIVIVVIVCLIVVQPDTSAAPVFSLAPPPSKKGVLLKGSQWMVNIPSSIDFSGLTPYDISITIQPSTKGTIWCIYKQNSCEQIRLFIDSNFILQFERVGSSIQSSKAPIVLDKKITIKTTFDGSVSSLFIDDQLQSQIVSGAVVENVDQVPLVLGAFITDSNTVKDFCNGTYFSFNGTFEQNGKFEYTFEPDGTIFNDEAAGTTDILVFQSGNTFTTNTIINGDLTVIKNLYVSSDAPYGQALIRELDANLITSSSILSKTIDISSTGFSNTQRFHVSNLRNAPVSSLPPGTARMQNCIILDTLSCNTFEINELTANEIKSTGNLTLNPAGGVVNFNGAEIQNAVINLSTSDIICNSLTTLSSVSTSLLTTATGLDLSIFPSGSNIDFNSKNLLNVSSISGLSNLTLQTLTASSFVSTSNIESSDVLLIEAGNSISIIANNGSSSLFLDANDVVLNSGKMKTGTDTLEFDGINLILNSSDGSAGKLSFQVDSVECFSINSNGEFVANNLSPSYIVGLNALKELSSIDLADYITAGSNVTIVPSGNGGVTISANGGGGGNTFTELYVTNFARIPLINSLTSLTLQPTQGLVLNPGNASINCSGSTISNVGTISCTTLTSTTASASTSLTTPLVTGGTLGITSTSGALTLTAPSANGIFVNDSVLNGGILGLSASRRLINFPFSGISNQTIVVTGPSTVSIGLAANISGITSISAGTLTGTTSITTPSLVSSGALSISSTGGTNGITFSSGSGTVDFGGATITNFTLSGASFTVGTLTATTKVETPLITSSTTLTLQSSNEIILNSGIGVVQCAGVGFINVLTIDCQGLEAFDITTTNIDGSNSGLNFVASSINGFFFDDSVLTGGVLGLSSLRKLINFTFSGTSNQTTVTTGASTVTIGLASTISGLTSISAGTLTGTTSVTTPSLVSSAALTISSTGGSNGITFSSGNSTVDFGGATLSNFSISGGSITVGTLTATTKVETPLLTRNSGNLSISTTTSGDILVNSVSNVSITAASSSFIKLINVGTLSAGVIGLDASNNVRNFVFSETTNQTTILTDLSTRTITVGLAATISGLTSITSGTLTGTTSVTTPSIISPSALTLSSTGGSNGITFSSGNGTVDFGGATITNFSLSGASITVGTLTATTQVETPLLTRDSGTLSISTTTSGDISLSSVANVSITAASGSFIKLINSGTLAAGVLGLDASNNVRNYTFSNTSNQTTVSTDTTARTVTIGLASAISGLTSLSAGTLTGTTSVTTPSLVSSGALTISSTGGSNGITFSSGSGTVDFGGATITNFTLSGASVTVGTLTATTKVETPLLTRDSGTLSITTTTSGDIALSSVANVSITAVSGSFIKLINSGTLAAGVIGLDASNNVRNYTFSNTSNQTTVTTDTAARTVTIGLASAISGLTSISAGTLTGTTSITTALLTRDSGLLSITTTTSGDISLTSVANVFITASFGSFIRLTNPGNLAAGVIGVDSSNNVRNYTFSNVANQTTVTTNTTTQVVTVGLASSVSGLTAISAGTLTGTTSITTPLLTRASGTLSITTTTSGDIALSSVANVLVTAASGSFIRLTNSGNLAAGVIGLDASNNVRNYTFSNTANQTTVTTDTTARTVTVGLAAAISGLTSISAGTLTGTTSITTPLLTRDSAALTISTTTSGNVNIISAADLSLNPSGNIDFNSRPVVNFSVSSLSVSTLVASTSVTTPLLTSSSGLSITSTGAPITITSGTNMTINTTSGGLIINPASGAVSFSTAALGQISTILTTSNITAGGNLITTGGTLTTTGSNLIISASTNIITLGGTNPDFRPGPTITRSGSLAISSSANLTLTSTNTLSLSGGTTLSLAAQGLNQPASLSSTFGPINITSGNSNAVTITGSSTVDISGTTGVNISSGNAASVAISSTGLGGNITLIPQNGNISLNPVVGNVVISPGTGTVIISPSANVTLNPGGSIDFSNKNVINGATITCTSGGLVLPGGLSTLAYYGEATLSCTFGVGATQSGSITVRIIRIGKFVVISIPSFSIASISGKPASSANLSTSLYATGSVDRSWPSLIQVGSTWQVCLFTVFSTGQMQFATSSFGDFSGTIFSTQTQYCWTIS